METNCNLTKIKKQKTKQINQKKKGETKNAKKNELGLDRINDQRQ
ncbi:MAG: hypothetical protein WC467_01135 [Patescibacteria group bacterium]